MRSASSSSPRACSTSAILPCVIADGAYVAQALVDGQFLFAADAQRFVEFAAGLQHVGDLAVRDRAERTSPKRS